MAKYKDVTKDQFRNLAFTKLCTLSQVVQSLWAFLRNCFLSYDGKLLNVQNPWRNESAYQMLRKIGVRRELLARSIYKELLLVFLFPATIGISHVIVGMNMFSFILIDPYFRIWVPLVIFAVIYTIYYLITVQLYKGIVLPKEES